MSGFDNCLRLHYNSVNRTKTAATSSVVSFICRRESRQNMPQRVGVMCQEWFPTRKQCTNIADAI